MNQKQRMERGITLIELAIALMLVAVVVAGVVTWMSGINQQLQLRGDAKHFSSVAKAAQLYLKGERGELIKEYNAGTTTKLVTIKDLQDTGYLATEIQSTLGRKQQNITMLIKLSKPAHSVEIRSLLITSGGITNTPDYTNSELGTMVNMAGTSAGFMAKAGEPIQGISGSWEVKATDWSFGPEIKPGHLVALLTDTLTLYSNQIKKPYYENNLHINSNIPNNTGKYLQINIRVHCDTAIWWAWGVISATVDGLNIAEVRIKGGGKYYSQGLSFIVPPGSVWRIIKESDMCYPSDGNQYLVTELN
ncbi:Bacterial shufflon protein%2C N-terminal constant region [Yersinia intermedia]|uniref:Bacterial shufflon protein, N-terminal constant region n=1 Tax=Yersinia intermedia TaxID=631 RepID=A0A0H5MHE7_YERIN|nr:shufflon system plasmid conjugative transfer pilus tip adhesin PilV [Yersinia intermedia]CRY56496.1 Bacterial shufflon protein%2C N-terminal constant region [Yersinia intermedia]